MTIETDAWKKYAQELMTWYGPALQNEKWGHLVSLVSLEWLLSCANPHPSETTDLGIERKDKEGNLIMATMPQLLGDLKRKGMQEPLIVQYGFVTKRARLEAGNHRVRLLLENGLLHAPVLLYMHSSHIGNPGNGSHEGVEVKAYPWVQNETINVGPYVESKFVNIKNVLPSAPILGLGPQDTGTVYAQLEQLLNAPPESPSAPSPERRRRRSKESPMSSEEGS